MNWNIPMLKWEGTMAKNINFVYKIILILTIFVTVSGVCLEAHGAVKGFAQEESLSCVREGANTGSMGAFKDNYIPVQYSPMPEWMFTVDLGVLVLLLIVGLYFVLKRKSEKALSILAIVTFAYLGFIRGGCVCPVGAITNTTMGLVTPSEIGLVSLIIFLAPLIIALIAGRVFCTSGCPLGAVQHLMQKNKKFKKVPAKINTALKLVPIGMLLATIYYAVQSACFLICELEPYKVIFFTGQIWFEQLLAFIVGNPMEPVFMLAFGIGTWIYLILVLVLGYWVPRPFCRFLCPYGVLLGVVSYFSFKPRRIENEACVHCGLCEKVCPTQAIVIDRKNKCSSLSNYDCVQCNKCTVTCRKDAFK